MAATIATDQDRAAEGVNVTRLVQGSVAGIAMINVKSTGTDVRLMPMNWQKLRCSAKQRMEITKKTRRVQPSQATTSQLQGGTTVLQGGWAGANMAGARKKEHEGDTSVPVTISHEGNIQNKALHISPTAKAVPKFGAWQIGPSTVLKAAS